MQKKNIVLLDGGLGQEVHRRAGKPAHPLWSTQVMMESPEIVKSVHQDFIKAGAKIITLNSYTSTPTRLARDGKVHWFEPLQRQAIQIAWEARDELGMSLEQVQIAGCLPPLVGSYTTDNRSLQMLKDEYSQILTIQAPEVDLIIIETMSSVKEAKAAVGAALEFEKPILLSFTLSDTQHPTLRSGETIDAALREISGYNLNGLLFNCSFPETISKGLSTIGNINVPFGGYANGFTSVELLKPGGTVDVLTTRKDLNEEVYANHVLDWIQKGASIIGGCCEVGPSYIHHLNTILSSKGYQTCNIMDAI